MSRDDAKAIQLKRHKGVFIKNMTFIIGLKKGVFTLSQALFPYSCTRTKIKV